MMHLLGLIFTLGLTHAQILNGVNQLPDDLELYLQGDEVDSGSYDEPDSLSETSCTRPCKTGTNKFCYYRFTLEPYVVMGGACGDCLNNTSDCFSRGCVTADGFEKGILTVNRRLPGPSIQVCVGDVLIVDVKNSMPGRSTSLHWHGLRQKNYKFMDGVPMVTQCPITEGQTFRYTFRAEDPGLNFYHSHDGLQKVDGIVGSFVVRRPQSMDPNGDEYDFDLPSHVIVIQDWYHLMADDMFPGLRFNNTAQIAQTYLIQGKGKYFLDNGSPPLANTPLAQFNVTRGFRYVFRVVAGTCFECQYVFTIEDHDMLIIGADARPTKPYRVDSLTMSPGERFTVVVNCSREIRSYWMQVRAVGLCDDSRAHQVGLLHYNTAAGCSRLTPPPTYDDSDANRIGLTMNPLNSACGPSEAERGPCLHDLRGVEEADETVRRPKPDERIIWAFGFTRLQDQELFNTTDYIRFIQTRTGRFSSTINGVSNVAPPSPVLTQPAAVPDELLCPADGFPTGTWNKQHRSCVHIQVVPVNKVIEIVVVDLGSSNPDGLSHSIHLHGYDPYIAEMGTLKPGVSVEEAMSELLKYLDSDQRREMPADLVTKDTFAVSSRGYLVARIFTDNTGYWFFHCHFAYHLDSGMSGILQVGEQDTFPSPPARFPTCGDYLPNNYN